MIKVFKLRYLTGVFYFFDSSADISGDVDVFEFALDLIARVFWKVKQQQFESIDLSKDIAEFTINDIHDTVYEELDEVCGF